MKITTIAGAFLSLLLIFALVNPIFAQSPNDKEIAVMVGGAQMSSSKNINDNAVNLKDIKFW